MRLHTACTIGNVRKTLVSESPYLEPMAAAPVTVTRTELSIGWVSDLSNRMAGVKAGNRNPCLTLGGYCGGSTVAPRHTAFSLLVCADQSPDLGLGDREHGSMATIVLATVYDDYPTCTSSHVAAQWPG